MDGEPDEHGDKKNPEDGEDTDARFADNLGTLLGAPLYLSLIVPLVLPMIAAWSWLKGPVDGV